MQDRVPDLFEDLFEMPCSVIVSGAESGDQLPHTDVSTAPDMLPPLTATPLAATSPPSWPSPPSTASTSRRERRWGRPRRRGGTRSAPNRGKRGWVILCILRCCMAMGRLSVAFLEANVGNHPPEVAGKVHKILSRNWCGVWFGAHNAPDGEEAHILFQACRQTAPLLAYAEQDPT